MAAPKRKPAGRDARSGRHQPFTAPAMMPETSCLPGEDEQHQQRDGREHHAGEHDRVVDEVVRLQQAERRPAASGSAGRAR